MAFLLFFLLLLHPPPRSTLFPYTTLFRSHRTDQKESGQPAPYRHGLESRRTRSNGAARSEEHTSELQSQFHLVCRLLLEKKKQPTDIGCAAPVGSSVASPPPAVPRSGSGR